MEDETSALVLVLVVVSFFKSVDFGSTIFDDLSRLVDLLEVANRAMADGIYFHTCL